jgi:MoaA/NifB/PqqE/SkfB family radical SAM enzyme
MINKDTFCILPFIHLSVFQDGKVKPCCMADSFMPENYNDSDSFKEFFQNDTYKQLRDDLKNGVKNSLCDFCWKKEALGGRSFREEKNAHFKEQYDKFIENEEKEAELVFLDIRFSNQCNFKCRMCGERDSTSWYEERETFWNEECVKPVLNKVLEMGGKEEDVWNHIKPFDSKKLHILKKQFTEEELNNLEYVYIAGGEPLYTKMVWDFIEKIPHPENVVIQFQTNFSLLEYKEKSIFDFTKKFKQVVYSISLDGLFEVGEFQRTHFKTDNFLSNLKRLNEEIKSNPNISYDFTYTTTVINVFSFFETFDYLIENGYIKDYSNIRFQIAKWPKHLDAKNYHLIDEIKKYYSRTDIKGIEHNPFLKGDFENFILHVEQGIEGDISQHLYELDRTIRFSSEYNNIKVPQRMKNIDSLKK